MNMASSVIEICNSALTSVKANTIASFSDGSTEANICAAKFDIVRRSELRKSYWNFAIKDVELAKTVDAPIKYFQYKYTLPSDCVRLISVNDGLSFYKLRGRDIHTDANECFISYIADIEDTSQWDPIFVDVVSARMAYEIAYAIVGSGSLVEQAHTIYRQKLMEAKAVDQTEDFPDQLGAEQSSLISVRY